LPDQAFPSIPRGRGGPRSRAETEQERHQIEQETTQEVDRLVAEFHAQLPREQAKMVGAIYARYSTRFQHSIADQVRALFEAAVRENIFVPREHVCFDLAVRGFKERRPGLQKLNALLGRRAVQVLLVFTTNRLFRKTHKALRFVEEEVVERGIRCIFVKSGVDTADEKRWRMLLQIHAITDEHVAGMYADNVRAAQEGLFDRNLVWGTVTFGYQAKPVASGALTRLKNSRRAYEIDPERADWVRRIFTWYVEEGLPITGIIRRLNDLPSVPLGPKAASGRWTRLGVRLLLTNPRYRGLWQYGRTKNVWQSKGDYTRQMPREQPLRERHREELRIVSDEVWYRAQERLTKDPGKGGRPPKDGKRQCRPKCLNGFFFCSGHGRPLVVGGLRGLVMTCPECQALPAEKRPLFSHLNRKQALHLTCQKLAELIRPDQALIQEVITACQRETAQMQQPDPKRLAEAQARWDKLTRQIQFILENSGDTEADRQEAESSLRRLRGERSQLGAEMAQWKEAMRRPAHVPSTQEIEELLAQLGEVLARAGESERLEDVSAVRQVVKLLTGGRIDLVQKGEPRSHGGWLQGRFRLQLLCTLVSRLSGVPVPDQGEGEEVTIDYRRPIPAEQWAGEVKRWYDDGMLIKAIARKLEISPNLARRALAYWHKQQGVPQQDGRSRRSGLANPHLKMPLNQEIADRVMELYDQNVLLGDIAARLGCDRNTVTRAVAFWHTERGLPVPDGRTRRKNLPQPSRQMGAQEGG
jgi:DNA invertase Pin-like site-specific DNA recombinase